MGKRILCIGDSIPGDIYQAVGNDMKKMCAGRESLHRCLGKTMK